MAKINLNNITNPQSVSVMNANFQKIMVALDEQVLYRDNPDEEPNQMENDIDMNGKRIYNLPEPVADHEPLRLMDGTRIVVEQSQDLIDAANAATAAALAATIAADNANEAVSEVVGTANDALAAATTALSTANAASSNINTFKTDVASTAGSGLVGFIQDGVGAVPRTLQQEAKEKVSVTQFGATGGANDSLSFQKAIDFAIANNKTLEIPAGVWHVADLKYAAAPTLGGLIGDGSRNTILVNDINTLPVITFTGNQLAVKGIRFKGNGSVTSWGAGTAATNALVGTLPTTECSARILDLVHSSFEDCYFTDSLWGADVRGGICVTFSDCYAYWNAQVGFRVWRATGANIPNSGYPNVISFENSSAKENGQVGIYFDDGRALSVRGGDFEGNGKNTVQASNVSCGLYIGLLTGSENGTTNGPGGSSFHSFAALVDGAWFEQNGNNNGSGAPNGNNMGHIIHNHGTLVVKNSVFTNSTGGRVFRINGGQYLIEECAFETGLATPTNNVQEGPSGPQLLPGSYINGCTVGPLGTRFSYSHASVDTTKTFLNYVVSATKTLNGSGSTASGILTITWPAGTWTTTPMLFAQVNTNDGGTTTYSTEVFGVSTTGGTIRAKQNAAGTVTQPVLSVGWIAVGS